MNKYEHPGKFFRGGLLLGAPLTPKSLDEGLSCQFTHEDVMVVGYPKSGRKTDIYPRCQANMIP